MENILAFFKQMLKASLKNKINLNNTKIMIKKDEKKITVVFKKDTTKP